MPSHTQEEEFSLKNYFSPFTTLKAIHWIVIIGILVFFNGLFNSFVGDDLGLIVNNRLIDSFQNIPLFFIHYGVQNTLLVTYRPVILTILTIIHSIFGANPFVFHFFQISLHITNTIILFLFLQQFLKRFHAFLLALIFLIHPINSETVLAISYTQDILFFFFGILSLWFLTKGNSYRLLSISGVCMLLSLFSKETGVLFIFIALCYGFLFAKKYFIQILFTQSIVFIVYLFMRMYSTGIIAQSLGSPIGNLSLLQRTITMPAIFLFYVKTFFFPLNLSSSYQWIYTQIDFVHFMVPLLIDIIFLVALCFIGFIITKRFPRKILAHYVFFCVWLLLGILFHLQIISLDQTVAERWFYFSSVGMLGILGVLFEIFDINLKNKWVASVLIIVLILFSLRTFIRSFDWRNEYTIASHDIAISPEAWGLENELSFSYFQKGLFAQAKLHAEKSIQLYPYKTNYLNLGAADFSLKDYKGAKNAFEKAILYGNSNQAYDNLAFLALSYGDPHKNIAYIKNSALLRFPQDGKLWLCLAALEYNYGSKQNAVYEIQQAYTYDPEAQTIGVYNAIMNNEPVRITNGKTSSSTH